MRLKDGAAEFMLSTPEGKYAYLLPTLIFIKHQKSNHLGVGSYSIKYPKRTLLSRVACLERHEYNVYLVIFGQKHKSRSQSWIPFLAICFDIIQRKMTGQVNE